MLMPAATPTGDATASELLLGGRAITVVTFGASRTGTFLVARLTVAARRPAHLRHRFHSSRLMPCSDADEG